MPRGFKHFTRQTIFIFCCTQVENTLYIMWLFVNSKVEKKRIRFSLYSRKHYFNKIFRTHVKFTHFHVQSWSIENVSKKLWCLGYKSLCLEVVTLPSRRFSRNNSPDSRRSVSSSVFLSSTVGVFLIKKEKKMDFFHQKRETDLDGDAFSVPLPPTKQTSAFSSAIKFTSIGSPGYQLFLLSLKLICT